MTSGSDTVEMLETIISQIEKIMAKMGY